MNHIRLKFTWQLFDDQSVMRAFVDANSTTNAQAFRDVWFAGFVIKNNAFLSVANGWTEGMTFVIALLWLTTVFLQNGYSHRVTSFSVILLLFAGTYGTRAQTTLCTGIRARIGQSPTCSQMSPFKCSCPLMRRTVHGVGNFMLALRSASRAVR